MQIDSNTDGLVDFTEFVAATLHVHQLEEHDSEKWQQRSRAAFEKFDIDKDGFITPEELKMVSVNLFCWLCLSSPRRHNHTEHKLGFTSVLVNFPDTLRCFLSFVAHGIKRFY